MKPAEEQLEDLAKLVAHMRRAQARYFKDRTQANLRAAKDWERRVDARVGGILRPPLSYTLG